MEGRCQRISFFLCFVLRVFVGNLGQPHSIEQGINFHLSPSFPPTKNRLFATARSGQGRARSARRSGLLTARTAAERGEGGKERTPHPSARFSDLLCYARPPLRRAECYQGFDDQWTTVHAKVAIPCQ